jgi:hypothetical protein
MSVAAHDAVAAVAAVAAALQQNNLFRKKTFKLKLGTVKKFSTKILSRL